MITVHKTEIARQIFFETPPPPKKLLFTNHVFRGAHVLLRGAPTLKKMIFALCSISLIKMSSYNITLGKNGPNLILLNINNVI